MNVTKKQAVDNIVQMLKEYDCRYYEVREILSAVRTKIERGKIGYDMEDSIEDTSDAMEAR